MKRRIAGNVRTSSLPGVRQRCVDCDGEGGSSGCSVARLSD